MPDCMLAKVFIVFTSELWVACDLKPSFEVSPPYAFVVLYLLGRTHEFSFMVWPSLCLCPCPRLSFVIILPCTDIPCWTPAAAVDLK